MNSCCLRRLAARAVNNHHLFGYEKAHGVQSVRILVGLVRS